MTRLVIKIILLFIFISTQYSQQIKDIIIKGNSVFPASFYLNNLPVSKGSPFFTSYEDSITNSVSNLLAKEGYYNSSISISKENIDQDQATLSIEIEEGTAAIIKNFTLVNLNTADSLNISELISKLKNNIFSQTLIEYYINMALNYFERIGFPYATIKTNPNFILSGDQQTLVELNLVFEKGLLCNIDEIIVEGNTSTKDYVITRELRLESGELYNQDIINKIPAQLNRLRFFKPVQEPQFLIDEESGKGILKIDVEEINTNNFDGIVGYVPGDQNSSGYFTGYVDIYMRNLFGTGRQAKINWHQESRNTQELDVGYLEPWLFGYPFNVSLGLYQRKEDTLFVQRNVNLSLEYLAFRNISASFLFQSESVIPSENSGSVNNVLGSDIISTGLNIKIDTRDDPFSPKSGLLFINSYTYNSKEISDTESLDPSISGKSSLQKISVDLDFYQTLFTAQVLKLSLHGREMRGDFFEYSDLFTLGGTRSLRGYREKQFRGNRIFWSNLEYRYLFDQRSFVYTFFDTGYFLRREEALTNTPKLDATKYGFGFGINIETGVGILNVSYALGEGDNFSNGKIHFGIANEF